MTPDQFTQQFSVFRTLNREDLALLLETLEASHVGAGTCFIASGVDSDALYLIAGGRVRVTLESNGDSTVLGEFGPGQWAGEMGMIEPAPACASVAAVEDCSLLRLSHADFMALRRKCPSLTSSLLKVFSDQLAERLRSTLHFVDTGETVAGQDRGEGNRNWFIEAAQRIVGLAARTGA